MNKIIFHVFSGTMVSGKTKVINQIKEQVSNNNIYYFMEDNFYLQEDIEKYGVANKHFFVQKLLLNNFIIKYKKIMKDILDLINLGNSFKIDLIFDTFPFVTGSIFTKLKKQNFLINAEEYNILRASYIDSIKIFQTFLHQLNKMNVKIEIENYFRIIDFELSKVLLKERSEEEFDFYIRKYEYYKNLHQDLSDYAMYEKKIRNIIDSNLYNINRYQFNLFRIKKIEDFDFVNKQTFEKFYCG